MSSSFLSRTRIEGRIEALKRELSNENLSRSGSKSKSPLRDNYYRLANEKKSGAVQSDYKPKEERYSSPFSKATNSGIDSAVQNNKNQYNYSNTDPIFKSLIESNADNSTNKTTFDFMINNKAGRSYTPQNVPEEKDTSYNINARRNSGFEKTSSSFGGSTSINMTGFANSGSNYNKPDNRTEEGERMIIYAMNELSSQISDTLDKEKLWRNRKINLEYDDLGWHDSDVTEWLTSTDAKILKQSETGRAMLDVKAQFNSMRGLMEDLITDVETLSKTMNRGNADFKENVAPKAENDTSPGSTAQKLLAAIQDTKKSIENMKSVALSDGIDEYMKQIPRKNDKKDDIKSIIRTLHLQVEQSKRERRILEIENALLKKTQGNTNILKDPQSLKNQIREIIQNEIDQTKNL